MLCKQMRITLWQFLLKKWEMNRPLQVWPKHHAWQVVPQFNESWELGRLSLRRCTQGLLFFRTSASPSRPSSWASAMKMRWTCRTQRQRTRSHWPRNARPSLTVLVSLAGLTLGGLDSSFFFFNIVMLRYSSGSQASLLVEHQTCWNIASSRSGRRVLFSRVNFLCERSFGVRSTPVLPQWHLRKTGRSATSAGGRLHLNTPWMELFRLQPDFRIQISFRKQ